MTVTIAECLVPGDGVWRVGPGYDPFATRDLLTPEELADPQAGNRFDSPLSQYRVIYFGTTLEACFRETLSRFRPDPRLLPIIRKDWEDQGFMLPGDVPRDWRHRRLAVRAVVDGAFLDVEADGTRAVLEGELAALLSAFGYKELDMPAVMACDRRVTRWISQWAWNRTDESGYPRFAGIRYLSRLGTQLELWGVFDARSQIEEVERRPIALSMPELQRAAERYGLQVH